MVTYFQSNTAFYVNYVVLFQVTKFRENLVTKKDKEKKKDGTFKWFGYFF